MNKSKLTLKPLDNYHTHYLFLALIIFVPFDILLLTVFDYMLLWVVLIMNILPFSVFLLIRILYRAKYSIDDICLTKYRGDDIVFCIKNNDIQKIFIKKGKWYSFLQFSFLVALGSSPDEQIMTNISILFKNCEVLKTEKRETLGASLKTAEYEAFFEWNEIMSLKKCVRICKKIGVEPIFV